MACLYVIGNHDMTRSYNRYGDGQHNDQIAKIMAGMYLTPARHTRHVLRRRTRNGEQRPSAQGGCEGSIGIAGWPAEKGRDGERTPMQWNDSSNAGFSQPLPGYLCPPVTKPTMFETELKIRIRFASFKRLLVLRHQESALLDGDYVALNQDNRDVLVVPSPPRNEAVLVVLNMSNAKQKIGLDLSPKVSLLLRLALADDSCCSACGRLDQVALDPFAVYIARISQ